MRDEVTMFDVRTLEPDKWSCFLYCFCLVINPPSIHSEGYSCWFVCMIKLVREWPCPLLCWVLTTSYAIASALCLCSKSVTALCITNGLVLKFRSSGENPIQWSPTMHRLILSWWCDSLGLLLSSLGFFSVTHVLRYACYLWVMCTYYIFSSITEVTLSVGNFSVNPVVVVSFLCL